MQVNYKLVLALVATTALGAVGMQSIHAQTKPPVYVVVDINEITDPAGWAAVGGRSNEAAAKTFQEFGGRYIARTDNITALDGTPPKRFVIIRFDTMEKAQGWYNSPVQQQVNATRLKTTKSRGFLIQGE